MQLTHESCYEYRSRSLESPLAQGPLGNSPVPTIHFLKKLLCVPGFGRPWSEKVLEVPMRANTILSVAGTEKHPRPSDVEIAETTALHMKLTGQLLWLARMCFPDLLFSCSQLSRVLSAIGWTALEFGMQMIRYAYSQRDRGIRFRSDGHSKLRAAYDASDNPDPKDGKSGHRVRGQSAGTVRVRGQCECGDTE